MKNKLDIIFEDDDMIVVNKASDLLSIPDRYDKTKPNLYSAVKNHCENAFVVHRLDKETTGIIVYAKNELAHANLSQQFERRVAKKTYWAIVEGTPMPETGIINKPIAPSLTTPGRVVINDRGKESITEYQVVKSFPEYSLVACDIKTGRTHQIRIHFKSIGHPLAVDPFYGNKTELFLSQIKLKRFKMSKWQEEEIPLVNRTTLHAYSLTLNHPTTGVTTTFESQPPKDFRALLQQLEKWGK